MDIGSFTRGFNPQPELSLASKQHVLTYSSFLPLQTSPSEKDNVQLGTEISRSHNWAIRKQRLSLAFLSDSGTFLSDIELWTLLDL